MRKSPDGGGACPGRGDDHVGAAGAAVRPLVHPDARQQVVGHRRSTQGHSGPWQTQQESKKRLIKLKECIKICVPIIFDIIDIKKQKILSWPDNPAMHASPKHFLVNFTSYWHNFFYIVTLIAVAITQFFLLHNAVERSTLALNAAICEYIST